MTKNTKTTEEKQLQTQEKPHPLQVMVNQATEERKILTSYITDHMVKGVDFAPIHINKTCDNKYNCTNKYHFSKDNLTKAGAEKIKDLLRLYPDFKRDSDTWEMAGSKPGLFCYRCILLTQDQKPAGVGLGACDATEKGGSMNTAIKIAKKRAFVDAILTTGSLSDFFTQDMEDIQPEEKPLTPRQMAEKKEEAEEIETRNETQQGVICEVCNQPATERKGLTRGGKNYHGIFCSTGNRSHTRWLWN